MPKLAGASVAGGVAPNVIQVGPKPEVPKFWADPTRIIRDVLDLWEKNPAEANLVHEWVRHKLAEMATGKGDGSAT